MSFVDLFAAGFLLVRIVCWGATADIHQFDHQRLRYVVLVLALVGIFLGAFGGLFGFNDADRVLLLSVVLLFAADRRGPFRKLRP